MLKLPRVCAPRQSDGGTTGMLPDPRSRSAADLLELGHFASGTTAVHKDIPSGTESTSTDGSCDGHGLSSEAGHGMPLEAGFTLSGGVGGNGGSDPSTDVILRLEAETDEETKGMMRLLHIAIFFGAASCIIDFVTKIVKSNIPGPVISSNLSEYENEYIRDILIISGVNCAVAVVIVCGLGYCLACFCRRLWFAAAGGRRWSLRRARLCGLYFALLMIQLVNALMYLLANMCNLDAQCRNSQWTDWAGVLRWTCWNSSFMLLVVSAHNNNLARRSSDMGEATKMVLDGKWLIHLPKLGWWLACEANLAFLIWHLYQPEPASYSTSCASPPWEQASTYLIAVGLFVWVILIVYYLGTATRSLRKRPYMAFRVANLVVRLQYRTSLLASLVITFSVVLLWFIHEGDCFSAVFTWYGLMPCQIVMAALVTVLAFFFMPGNDSSNTMRMRASLQEFAWTERPRDQILAERASQCSTHAQREAACAEPVFCFETACKALYWSILVYRLQEDAVSAAECATDLDDRAAEGVPELLAVSLDGGLALYSLTDVQVFREPSVDTKVVVAAGPNSLLLAFRGTASWANVVSDLQAWMVPYSQIGCEAGQNPLKPRVHRGFHAAWHRNSLNKRVIDHVRHLLNRRKTANVADMRVIITGHSLGGALATLAAHDLQLEFGFGSNLHCYTFGAPRTGNHAFAAESGRLVPETWHVINDQDSVTQFGKFWFAYKRSGHRCIINECGDILVRPFPLEQRLFINLRGGKLRQHLLLSYVKAFVAICDAQFTAKRLKRGTEGCLDVLKDPHVCQLLASGGLSAARALRTSREVSGGPGRKLCMNHGSAASAPSCDDAV